MGAKSEQTWHLWRCGLSAHPLSVCIHVYIWMGTVEILQPQADIRTPTLKLLKVEDPSCCPQVHSKWMLRIPL